MVIFFYVIADRIFCLSYGRRIKLLYIRILVSNLMYINGIQIKTASIIEESMIWDIVIYSLVALKQIEIMVSHLTEIDNVCSP